MEQLMKLKLDVDPDIVAVMATKVAAGERAVTAAIHEAGTGLKPAWRFQITSAGLGPRLANSIRSQIYRKAGESLAAAALVCSRAPVIVGARDTEPLIRSKKGLWLVIHCRRLASPCTAAGSGPESGRDDAVCACASSIGGRATACWWRKDG